MTATIENLSDNEIFGYYQVLFAAQNIVSKCIQSVRRRELDTTDRNEKNELRTNFLWLKLQDHILNTEQYQFEHKTLEIEPPSDNQIEEILNLSDEVAELQIQQELYSNVVNLATRAMDAYNQSQA